MVSPLRPTIHLWVPGLFDFKGGIQVYSHFLLTALQSLLPQARIRVFSMHDRQVPEMAKTSGVHFHTMGHVPPRLRTAAFAAQTLQAGLWDQPDLVITTHINFCPVAQILKRWIGVPYWGIAHGFEAWEIAKPSVQQALHHADLILAVSQYTRDRLCQAQGLGADRVGILPNTVDTERFQIQPKPQRLLDRYGLTADQPVVLTVNRLAAGEPFHSYDQILAALPAIRQAIPQVHYVIVGDGDDRPRLERELAQSGLADSVTVAGFIPDAELPDYYALCDVFAMPSKLEGFGIVYLEALACGKPVLAGQDGARDALLGGALGTLVDPDDRGAIATHLIALLQGQYGNCQAVTPEARRQQVVDTFGQEAFQRTLASYLVCLAGHSMQGAVEWPACDAGLLNPEVTPMVSSP